LLLKYGHVEDYGDDHSAEEDLEPRYSCTLEYGHDQGYGIALEYGHVEEVGDNDVAEEDLSHGAKPHRRTYQHVLKNL